MHDTMKTLDREPSLAIFLALLANIDVSLFKALVASNYWRSPRNGVNAALKDVAEAKLLMTSVNWPPALAEAAEDLKNRIEIFNQTLSAYDATSLHSEQRKVMDAIRNLRQALLNWGQILEGHL